VVRIVSTDVGNFLSQNRCLIVSPSPLSCSFNRHAAIVTCTSVAPRADVIVTDILLPGCMDGTALVERLKAGSGTSQIPVIVLTAFAWQSDRNRAPAASCDAFLTKPCLPDQLVRAIRCVVMSAQPRPVSAPVTPRFWTVDFERTGRRIAVRVPRVKTRQVEGRAVLNYRMSEGHVDGINRIRNAGSRAIEL